MRSLGNRITKHSPTRGYSMETAGEDLPRLGSDAAVCGSHQWDDHGDGAVPQWGR